MTSNCSTNHSNSCHWGREPTAWSQAWKKDHYQDESSSYDSLSLCPTANLQFRSLRTTKDFNFNSFQHKSSQLGDKDLKTTMTKQKLQQKSNVKNDTATNTASEY
ncbi:hypothetical protein O181_129317 [Austropuccinia psidii MF-1]|uniref:Uncharacterized protein n=1 Tax=Austropuccinia psidii MF-1 TaxID=1389203 RepID=A0A9Q3KYZ9_9BASI|nr:hypothetical protein [Austropuccinia psidii MF-1]